MQAEKKLHRLRRGQLAATVLSKKRWWMAR
jgi:hypothetical protein